MHILLTNDDGINSAGLFALHSRLKKMARVSVVAPEVEMSAAGHAITLSRPLRVKEFKRGGRFFGYAVDGTPADCVKIALTALFTKDRPELVVSGINLGPNVGFHVIYSGTVSAATEGLIIGRPSIAVSLNSRDENPHFMTAANFIAKLIGGLKENLNDKMLINVNVPNLPYNKIKGVRLTRQGKSTSVERYARRRDPRGNLYYWLTSELIRRERGKNTDSAALQNGYISVTPLHFDMTDYDAMDMTGRLIRKAV